MAEVQVTVPYLGNKIPAIFDTQTKHIQIESFDFAPGNVYYPSLLGAAMSDVQSRLRINRGTSGGLIELNRYAPRFSTAGQPVMASPVADSTDAVFGEAALS